MRDLFNKITGNVSDDDEEIYEDLDSEEEALWTEDEPVDQDRALSVDVYQDEDNLFIKAHIPGIDPKSLDIDISRDMVTIRGTSFRESSINDENYFQQELAWGSYSRSISLPREVDIDHAHADCRLGVLHLTLPKTDKDKRAKLRVG